MDNHNTTAWLSRLTNNLPISKFLQILNLSSLTTWRMGIHSWYARTPTSLRSVKQLPEGLNAHPAAVSFESADPAFQELSAIS